MYSISRSFLTRACATLCLAALVLPSFASAELGGNAGNYGGGGGWGGGGGGSSSGYGGGGSGYGGGEGGSHSGNASGYGGGSSGSGSYSGSGAGAGSDGSSGGSSSGWGGGEGGNSSPESYGGSSDGGSGGGLGGSYSSGYGAGDYSYSEAVDAANGGIDFSSSFTGNVSRGGDNISVTNDAESVAQAIAGVAESVGAYATPGLIGVDMSNPTIGVTGPTIGQTENTSSFGFDLSNPGAPTFSGDGLLGSGFTGPNSNADDVDDNNGLPSNPGQLGGLNYGNPEIGTPIGPNAITISENNVVTHVLSVPPPASYYNTPVEYNSRFSQSRPEDVHGNQIDIQVVTVGLPWDTEQYVEALPNGGFTYNQPFDRTAHSATAAEVSRAAVVALRESGSLTINGELNVPALMAVVDVMVTRMDDEETLDNVLGISGISRSFEPVYRGLDQHTQGLDRSDVALAEALVEATLAGTTPPVAVNKNGVTFTHFGNYPVTMDYVARGVSSKKTGRSVTEMENDPESIHFYDENNPNSQTQHTFGFRDGMRGVNAMAAPPTTYSFPETTETGVQTGNTITVASNGWSVVTDASGSIIGTMNRGETSEAYGLVEYEGPPSPNPETTPDIDNTQTSITGNNQPDSTTEVDHVEDNEDETQNVPAVVTDPDDVDEAATTEQAVTRDNVRSNNIGNAINTVRNGIGSVYNRTTETLGEIMGRYFSGWGNSSPDNDDLKGDENPATSTEQTMRFNSMMLASAQTGANADRTIFSPLRDAIRAVFDWLFRSGESNVYTDLVLYEANAAFEPYIQVLVQIDEATGKVQFSRMSGKDNKSEINGSSDDQPALLIDAEGNIIYSDGQFASPTDSEIAAEFGDHEYVYFIERTRNGEAISAETHRGSLPGNIFTNAFSRVFGDNSPFTLADVESVTYAYVDPDPNKTGDEYKDYSITLKDGSTRNVALPIETSLAFYTSQLAGIGYNGDAFALTNLGAETARQIGAPQETEGFFGGIVGLFTSDNETPKEYTDLTNFETDTERVQETEPTYTEDDILSALVYLEAPIACPGFAESTLGSVYEIIVNLPNEQKDGVIGGVMCGTGTAEMYAQEIANNLIEQNYFTNLDSDTIFENLSFRFYEMSKVADIPEDRVIPNETNQVTFEAKITNGGATVTDWTANNITLQAGEQLHLRWNATAYARCLPFIADNGAYSLGRGGDLAMRTGNTETEGYDVSEQSGTYRIECDGQANGEEGVDERRIEVLVR